MIEQLAQRLSFTAGRNLLRWLTQDSAADVQAIAVLSYCSEYGVCSVRPDWTVAQFMFWLQLNSSDIFVYEDVFLSQSSRA